MSSEVLTFYKLLEKLTTSLSEDHVKRKITQALEHLEDLPIVFKKQELSGFLMQVCQKVGLQSITDEMTDSLTLCGNIFVFDINPKSAQNDIKAKVTLASHAEVTLLENYLSNLLRDGKWWRFTRAFEYLAFLDQHSSLGKIDLFKYQFGIEKDWTMIANYEANQMNGVDSKISGHGKISVFDNQYGVVLEYFPKYYANINLVKSEIFSLKLLPDSHDNYLRLTSNGLDFHEGLDGSGHNIIYRLLLKPQVLISMDGMNYLKGINEVHVAGGMKEKVSYISKLTSKVEDGDSDAFMIGEIPFQHPSQVYNVLSILRRQLMFNILVSSCFKDEQKNGLKPLISITKNDFFKNLHIRFYHKTAPHVFYLKIKVEDFITYEVEADGRPVQSRGVNQYLTEQLSVPQFINTLEID